MARHRRGVKIGYYIPGWTYRGRWRERKLGRGIWRFSFKATKRRYAKSMGGHPLGRTIRWKINGYQDVVKTGLGRYQTHFYGKKKLVKVGRKRLKRF